MFPVNLHAIQNIEIIFENIGIFKIGKLLIFGENDR